MFGPRNPRLPTEVCLAIFKDPVLTAIDLLRCSGVDRAWHALIQNTNDIRTLLFLPPLNSKGKVDMVKAPAQDEPAWMALLYRPPQKFTAAFVYAAYERYDRADLLPSWDTITAHPLLFAFEHHAPSSYSDIFDHTDTETRDGEAEAEAELDTHRGYLGLTYQLFQHLSQPQYSHETASWRHMRVAYPPVRDVLIRLHPGNSIWVHDDWGVTLGDVVERLKESGPWRSSRGASLEGGTYLM